MFFNFLFALIVSFDQSSQPVTLNNTDKEI